MGNVKIIDTSKIQTLEQFVDSHPGILLSTLRWWLFDEAKSGIRAAGAALRLGKRVYIVPEKFDEWFTRRVDEWRGPLAH